MNYNYVQQPQQFTNQNFQAAFPQPQGNVYNINSNLEVANVPVGAGISVALCMPENTMFIKTIQNGNPMFYPYKILPYTDTEKEDKNMEDKMTECLKRIENLEESIKPKKKGVDFGI